MVILPAILFVIYPYYAGKTQIVIHLKPILLILLFPMYVDMSD